MIIYKRIYFWFLVVFCTFLSACSVSPSRETPQTIQKISSSGHNNDEVCKTIASQEYQYNAECLRKVKNKNLTGVAVFDESDKCFSYLDTKDYSPNRPCTEVEQRNLVLWSICSEATSKKLPYSDNDTPDTDLERRILTNVCMIDMVFTNKSFKELSKEIGNSSSFDICANASECSDQEICNVNSSSRCKKSEQYLYSYEEMDKIIPQYERKEMWCAHSGQCSITSTDNKSYSYKNTTDVHSLLTKYRKSVESEWTE